MKSTLRALQLLSGRERRQALWVMVLLLGLNAGELVSIGLIFPFISLVMDPNIVETNKYFHWLYEQMGTANIRNFQLQIGFILLAFYIIKTAYSHYSNRYLVFYAKKIEHGILCRLLKSYLSEPYPFFMKNPASALYHRLVGEAPYVAQFIHNFLIIATETILILTILGLFLRISPPLTLLLVGSGVIIILSNVLFTSKTLKRLSTEREKCGLGRGRSTLQYLNGIKDVKIFNNEFHFLRLFSRYDEGFLKSTAEFESIKGLQQRLIEMFSVFSIIAMLMYAIYAGTEAKSMIPAISVFALGAFRMLPSLVRILSSYSIVKFLMNAIDPIYEHFVAVSKSTPPRIAEVGKEDFIGHRGERIEFQDSIELKVNHFEYESRRQTILKNIEILLPKNKTIGIAGESGTGKTSLVDILLGLNTLQSGQGEIVIDGHHTLTPESLYRFRNSIGYVPQRVFLFDAPISHNIAFGELGEDIDMKRVIEVTKIAQLYEFVDSLPEKFNTEVGEFGVKISGGQIQRLGIARALYHNPDLLILDEATSSLDNKTEADFMLSIRKIMGTKTIVIIAHRMATIQDADLIYFLENGTISAQGRFENLVKDSAGFRALASHQNLETSLQSAE